MESPSRIAELAALIAKSTAIVDDYLNSRGLRTPSFDADQPMAPLIPEHEVEVKRAQDLVIASTEELNKLMHLEPAASEANVTRNYLEWLTQVIAAVASGRYE